MSMKYISLFLLILNLSNCSYTQSPGGMSPKRRAELVEKVAAGDKDAAYQLYFHYSAGEVRKEAAYYWAVQAKKLGHPDVTAKFLRETEQSIYDFEQPTRIDSVSPISFQELMDSFQNKETAGSQKP